MHLDALPNPVTSFLGKLFGSPLRRLYSWRQLFCEMTDVHSTSGVLWQTQRWYPGPKIWYLLLLCMFMETSAVSLSCRHPYASDRKARQECVPRMCTARTVHNICWSQDQSGIRDHEITLEILALKFLSTNFSRFSNFMDQILAENKFSAWIHFRQESILVGQFVTFSQGFRGSIRMTRAFGAHGFRISRRCTQVPD